MKKLSRYKLRPHHSLCIQFFVGKGYSDEFVQEMKKIIKILERENPTLMLVDECDILCKACPNKINGKCISSCKVHKIDTACLNECMLGFGDTISWNELKDLAYRKIIAQNKISEVCKGCEWSCKKQRYL